MVGRRGRRRRAAGLVLLAGVGGCQATNGVRIAMAQTPPTVRAASEEDHPGAAVRAVTRETRGGQNYYTVGYRLADGSEYEVVYNGAGNEIDKR